MIVCSTYDSLMKAVEKLLSEGKNICYYRKANALDGVIGWLLFL